LQDVEEILDGFVRTEGYPEVVQFSGGEPTIHPEIVPMLRAAKARHIRHVMINTNGKRIATDDAFLADLADRVRLGALPYRDFSTYYTPGIFYLFAAVLKVFGASVLPIRYLTAGLRAAAAVLMFSLTRRVAPWPWALVPVVVVLALDHWPIEPEPHPSWPAIVACLVTLELVARHTDSGKVSWLAAAGALAGVSFVFKQNVGAFTALGVAAYVVLRPRPQSGRVLRAIQVLFAVLLCVAVSAFLWSGWTGFRRWRSGCQRSLRFWRRRRPGWYTPAMALGALAWPTRCARRPPRAPGWSCSP